MISIQNANIFSIDHFRFVLFYFQSIHLKWSDDSTDAADRRGTTPDPSCPGARHFVKLRQGAAGRVRTWRVDGARQSVSIHGLEPGTEYRVRVVGVSCEGMHRKSRWISARTADYTSTRSGRTADTSLKGESVLLHQYICLYDTVTSSYIWLRLLTLLFFYIVHYITSLHLHYQITLNFLHLTS